MRKLALTLGLAALAAAAVPADAKGPPPGRGGGQPARSRSDLAATEADADAACRVDVKHFGDRGRREERSWLRFKLRSLEPNADYTIWIDDPSTPEDPTLVQVPDVTVTTADEGDRNHRFDTKHGGSLPFGATLADLGGMAVEVRNADGVAVLTGSLPAVQ
jgi:hypothetical protein